MSAAADTPPSSRPKQRATGNDLAALATIIEEGLKAHPEVSLRDLCRRVGKSEGYLSAFLTPPPGRRRNSLDIDTLRALSRELDIPLYKLVEPGFGVSVQELYEEMQTVAGLSVSDPMSGLTSRDREKVRDLIALVRAWDERNAGPEPRRPPGRKHQRREDISKEA